MKTEHPILFSTPMVKAILEGRKTQTRRIITDKQVLATIEVIKNGIENLCKYKTGNTLWVREEHYRYGFWKKNGLTKKGNQKWVFFAASEDVKYFDNPPDVYRISRDKFNPELRQWYKRLARFMPKSACRIKLEITNIRVERLQDISESDAKAEGVETLGLYPGYNVSNRGKYEGLWNLINGNDSWDLNPWVWVIEFKRIK